MVSAIAASAELMPLQAVEITPVFAPSMPAYRVDAFRETVAARLRAGTPISTVLQEQQALVLALADPAFELAMAQAYVAEMTDQSPKHHLDVPAAQKQMHGLLNNRIRDAHAFVALLSTPEFIQSAGLKAAEPAPAHKEPELPEAKKEEVIGRLLQPNDPHGAEPAIHIEMSVLGQQMGHMALAHIYRPIPSKPGAMTLLEPLEAALVKAWPQATGKQIQEAATVWLKARHDMAHSLANELEKDGGIYKEAMRRATTPASAPVPQVKVPVLAPARLEAPSESIGMGGV